MLKVLDAFEALVDRKTITDDAKKRIATELLASVPPEIMAPGCKNTSDAVRSIIRDYIGVNNDGSNPGKAKEARSGTKEIPSSEETVSPKVQQEVAGSGDRDRVQEPPKGTLGRPGVEGVEAGKGEVRHGIPPRKANRRS